MKRLLAPLVLSLVVGGTVAGVLIATNADAATGTPTPAATTYGRGACGSGLASNPEAAKAMLALRADMIKDMQAWWAKYGSNPTSDAAQKALRALRLEHRTAVQELRDKYGITAPAGRGAGCGGAGRGGAGRGGGAGYGHHMGRGAMTGGGTMMGGGFPGT